VDGLKCSLWENGPDFLLRSYIEWPHLYQIDVSLYLKLSENKISATLHSVAKSKPNVFLSLTERCSSFDKLLRIMAYVHRFTKKKKGVCDSVISARELRLSFLRLVQIIQKLELGSEFFKSGKSQVLAPQFQRLNPFIHTFELDGVAFRLIRVGGRLLDASIPYDAKFPLMLSQKSQFVKLFLRNFHKRHYHAGAKVMVSLLRQQIWLINAREACTKIVRDCVHYFRYEPVLFGQIMSNLPAYRVRQARPFLICGVDFCGPFYVSL